MMDGGVGEGDDNEDGGADDRGDGDGDDDRACFMMVIDDQSDGDRGKDGGDCGGNGDAGGHSTDDYGTGSDPVLMLMVVA